MSNRLFKWSVENDNLSDYFNLSVQSITTISTDRSHGGTKSIKYAPRSTASTNGDTVIRQPLTFTGTTVGDDVAWTANKTELYFRGGNGYQVSSTAAALVDMDGDFTPAGDNTKGLDSQTFDGATGGVFGWGLAVFDNGLGYAIDPPTVWTWVLDQWNHIEIYVKLQTAGSSTDTLKVWMNGSLQYNNTAIQLRSSSTDIPTGYGEFAIVTNFDPGAPHDGTGGSTLDDSTWYIDDIEIWDGMPSGDITDPVVTITGPTSSATYATGTSPLTISGTASDDVALTSVTWVNDRGGSGTATGTTSWSFSATLSAGVNVITVTATDTSSNTATDVITVTYTPGSRILRLRPATMM